MRDLIDKAFQRQKEIPGTMVVGAVMQHLVGAKLEVSVKEICVEHNGFSGADEPSGRKGDFLLGNTAIHVTTAPTESLIAKCQSNLDEGLQALVITTETGVGGAEALAADQTLGDRIEVLEIGQFVTTNICELSRFSSEQRPGVIRQIFTKYNEIVDQCETDPSLKVAVE